MTHRFACAELIKHIAIEENTKSTNEIVNQHLYEQCHNKIDSIGMKSQAEVLVQKPETRS